MTDCENRTGANRNQRVQVWLEKLFAIRLTGSRLSRLPFREMIKTTQVRGADQALYHHELTVSSLGSVCQSCTAPLLKPNASHSGQLGSDQLIKMPETKKQIVTLLYRIENDVVTG